MSTPAPEEIARKVLEAGETAAPRPWASRAEEHNETRIMGADGVWREVGRIPARVVREWRDEQGRRALAFLAELNSAGTDNDANAAFIVAACNGAETLARAVIELSAENEKIREAAAKVAPVSSGVSSHPTLMAGERGWIVFDKAKIGRERAYFSDPREAAFFILALAALSPTGGDGRTKNDG